MPTAAVAGKNHALFLTSKGGVLLLGDHLVRPQLSLSNAVVSDLGALVRRVPKRAIEDVARIFLPAGGRIAEASAFRHTLLRLEDGSVLAWGYGEAGQLGYARHADGSHAVRTRSHELRVAEGKDDEDAIWSGVGCVGWEVKGTELEECRVR